MPPARSRHLGHAWHLSIALILGALCYVCFRDPRTAVLAPLHWFGLGDTLTAIQQACMPLRARLPAWALYNLPDLIWTYLACWIAALWIARWRPRAVTVGIVLTGGLAIAIEFAQALPILPGTFDWLDVLACAAGAAIAAWYWRPQQADIVPAAPACNWGRRIGIGATVIALGLSNIATSYMRPTHRPVYLSWPEFRRAVRIEKPRSPGKRGKIIVVDSLLLMSEPNRGVHLFDNADPKHPKALAFLRVPGNLDMAVKAGYLYADSFVDLLVFKLDRNPSQIRLVKRIRDAFPYDPLQTLPVGRRIWPDKVRKGYGVVIDWTPIVNHKSGGR